MPDSTRTPLGVVDLHLHTTASDGHFDPAALVDLAWRAGIRTMSVTDHDTTAGLAEADRAARMSRVSFVNGIEITAVHEGRDIHMLGYFFDRDDAEFAAFLESQRLDRLRRVHEMADRLLEMGKPIDRESIISSKAPGKSLGRPLVAKALVKAGHVADIRQAFDQLIGEGKPAFVERSGPGPAAVINVISRAGGVSSLAHPGPLRRDDLIPAMVDAGLTALEAFHSEHDPATTGRYLEMAARHGLLVTGGSDYHGEEDHRRSAFGSVGLPEAQFERLAAYSRKG